MVMRGKLRPAAIHRKSILTLVGSAVIALCLVLVANYADGGFMVRTTAVAHAGSRMAGELVGIRFVVRSGSSEIITKGILNGNDSQLLPIEERNESVATLHESTTAASVSSRRSPFPYAFPRGLHWQNRWPKKGAFENKLERLNKWPYEVPVLDDPGSEYLKFKAELVSSEFQNKPMLVYDLLLVRSADKFGLINDGYSVEEMRNIMQGVVDIFAAGNIYIRVALDEIQQIRQVSRMRSVAYATYVEGPDSEELELRNSTGRDENDPHSSRLPQNWPTTKRLIHNKEVWLKKVAQETFGVDFVDMLRGHKRAIGEDAYRVHSMIEQDYLDWTLGVPHANDALGHGLFYCSFPCAILS